MTALDSADEVFTAISDATTRGRDDVNRLVCNHDLDGYLWSRREVRVRVDVVAMPVVTAVWPDLNRRLASELSVPAGPASSQS